MKTMIENQPVINGVEYAGFWRRAGALAIDFLLFMIPSVVINIVTFKLLSLSLEGGAQWDLNAYLYNQVPYHVVLISSLVSQIVWCVVVAWFFAKYKWQATPGKRLLKVYVVNIDGKKISFLQGFVRALMPVLLVVLLNCLNIAIFNKASETSLNAYEIALGEFFPEVTAQVKSESGKSIKEFIQTEEGKARFSSEINKLAPERESEFTARVKELMDSEKIYQKSSVYMPFVFMVLLILWFIPAAFTKQRTAMHDIIAKTRVLKGWVNN
jgi:uncharacterized RDD family membrane protein YckC